MSLFQPIAARIIQHFQGSINHHKRDSNIPSLKIFPPLEAIKSSNDRILDDTDGILLMSHAINVEDSSCHEEWLKNAEKIDPEDEDDIEYSTNNQLGNADSRDKIFEAVEEKQRRKFSASLKGSNDSMNVSSFFARSTLRRLSNMNSPLGSQDSVRSRGENRKAAKFTSVKAQRTGNQNQSNLKVPSEEATTSNGTSVSIEVGESDSIHSNKHSVSLSRTKGQAFEHGSIKSRKNSGVVISPTASKKEVDEKDDVKILVPPSAIPITISVSEESAGKTVETKNIVGPESTASSLAPSSPTSPSGLLSSSSVKKSSRLLAPSSNAKSKSLLAIKFATSVKYDIEDSLLSMGSRPPAEKEGHDMISRSSVNNEAYSLWNHGIDSLSVFLVNIEFLFSISYFSELWLIPVAICYDLQLPRYFSIIVSTKNTLEFLLEHITLRSNHPAMKLIKNPTVQDWRLHYWKNRLLVDVITIFPFELLAIDGNEYLWAIRLLRMYKLFEITRTSPIYNRLRVKTQEWFRIGNAASLFFPLMFLFILFMHVQACVIFLTGRVFDFSNDDIEPYRDAIFFDQYMWSLYMSTANMFPLGYHPKNPMEQFITAVFVIAGAGLYACIVGAISSIAMGFDASGRLYKQKVDELKEYMRWKCLNPVTQRKVLKYYELKYRGKYFEEGSLLNEMNESLRMEIAVHNCRELISKVSFLKREQHDGRDDLFAGCIATALQPCYYVPGDILFLQGEIGADMYFLLSGSLNVLISGKRVAQLKDGAFFGELALYANTPRTATVQAASSCIVYRLSRDSFNSILDMFDDVKKKVKAIYNERLEKLKVEEDIRKLAAAKETISRVTFLRRDYQLDPNDDSFATKLASLFEPAFFAADDVIFNQGEMGDEMFVIKSGAVDVLVGGYNVSTLREGACFGELALIARLPRPSTVQASSVCMCYKVHRDQFAKILDEFPDIKLHVDALLFEKMREKN
ncbi:hypothetical protein HDU79_008816 [Rhizoclosmatium sp. JEL0117]|nr:hypothetical protein HDU79_008816 [Rhizoclosmatium sp. JEL0117]